MKKTNVLFVCLGNFCRSPSAEGVFRQRVEQRKLDEYINVDSAGTGRWHIGESPDPRAAAAAADRGIDISHLRGRQVRAQDFDDFDYIVAMDNANYADLSALASNTQQQKIHLFLDFANQVSETQVPDPYYEGGFPFVFSLIEKASDGLLDHIQNQA